MPPTLNEKAERKKSRVRVLFAAVILSQFLEYAIAGRFGEPYPALMMPAFTGTMTDRDGTIRLNHVTCKVLFADGQIGWLSANDLLSQTPDSNRMAIMFHLFSPPPTALAQEAPSITDRLFPGRALARARHNQKELDEQTKNWLKRRLHDLYPSREPEKVTFVWSEESVNRNQVWPTATQNATGVREVEF